MSANLLPCPFCGGQAEMDTRQPYRHVKTGEFGTAVAIYCTACPADMVVCREDVPEVEPQHVIDDWNRRAKATGDRS